MALNLERMDAPLGAEIHDVDLSQPVDDATFAEIENAFNTHSVLVFRDQDLTPEQQIAFSRRFGPLEVHVLSQYLHPDHPEILVVSNILKDGRNVGIPDAGRYWHTDLSYMAAPSRGSLLYAMEIPEKDGEVLGDTLFASASAAYDALPDAMKRRLDGVEALFSLSHRFSKLEADGTKHQKMTDDQTEQTPEVLHKLVQTHPVTGRKILFVNEGHAARIPGMPEDESRALLDELCDYCHQPEFVYRHRWRVGDLVMWDNIPTQHLAINDYALPLRRYMHRTTLQGAPMG